MSTFINNTSSLTVLVSVLLENYQGIAARQNSYFINGISEELKLKTSEENILELLSSILYTMAICSRDTRISISAGSKDDIVTLSIKDQSTFNSYAIRSKQQHLQELAGKMDGSLSITSKNPKETTISFSFTNAAEADTVYTRAA